MVKAFVIELDGVTAGLVLPERGGFRFRCSDPRFRALDDKKFHGVRQIYRRIGRMLGGTDERESRSAARPF